MKYKKKISTMQHKNIELKEKQIKIQSNTINLDFKKIYFQFKY